MINWITRAFWLVLIIYWRAAVLMTSPLRTFSFFSCKTSTPLVPLFFFSCSYPILTSSKCTATLCSLNSLIFFHSPQIYAYYCDWVRCCQFEWRGAFPRNTMLIFIFFDPRCGYPRGTVTCDVANEGKGKFREARIRKTRRAEEIGAESCSCPSVDSR